MYMYMYVYVHVLEKVPSVCVCVQEGIESPILRGEPLMPGSEEEMARPLWRANSLPDLCRSRQYLEPMPFVPFRVSPTFSRKEMSSHPQSQHQ